MAAINRSMTTALAAAITLILGFSARSSAETTVETWFDNTDHELTVYRIHGDEPGATMMIIGGIQGDEPGGYIAADLYADMLLEKGNLIVVPRANFFSIKRNSRGINGDMNRKFSEDPPREDDYDYRIVEKLKQLMAESDVLLNLHEGSGYYYPEYLSDRRNPMRYGQSIIIDADRYRTPSGVVIDLEGPALRVIEEINSNIKDEDHFFHLNDHDTFSDETRHAEQRGSATYNALSLFGIPGYGIESSKDIRSITTKVKYQTLAINAFMREYGIIPEHPSVYLPSPVLDHLVVTIEGNPNPLAIKNGATLSVSAGTRITVMSVVANYNRGLSVDIVGHGNTNDLERTVTIREGTSVEVYKDAFHCGEIAVNIIDGGDNTVSPHVHTALLEQVTVQVAGKNIVVSKSDTLHIVRGDIIKIVDGRLNDRSDRDFRLNFYGFVGNRSFNDAEDRGYDIDTAADLMGRLSLDGGESLYRIEALKNNSVIGKVYIALHDPEIKYVIVKNGSGARNALVPGDTVSCEMSGEMTILTLVSNVTADPAIETYWTDGEEPPVKLDIPARIDISSPGTIRFRRNSVEIGAISFSTSGKT